jgi:hypothetical protein
MKELNDCCTNCGSDSKKGQWWNLSDYYGISGYFCPACYDKVSHDSYRNPNHPGEYFMILLKQPIKVYRPWSANRT